MTKPNTIFCPRILFVCANDPILWLQWTTPVLTDPGGLVIWARSGLFRLIPNTVIRNAERARNIEVQVKENFPCTIPVYGGRISWDQGIPISPLVVRQLLCEKSESFSDSDSATESTDKDEADQP